MYICLELCHDGATLKSWSYSLVIHLLCRQQKQGRAHRHHALAYLPDLIGLNLLLQSHWGFTKNSSPLPRRAAAARTQSERSASTLQGEGKERTTIWGLVMVMPGAGAQGQRDCWSSTRGLGRKPVNDYGVVGQVMEIMKHKGHRGTSTHIPKMITTGTIKRSAHWKMCFP